VIRESGLTITELELELATKNDEPQYGKCSYLSLETDNNIHGLLFGKGPV